MSNPTKRRSGHLQLPPALTRRRVDGYGVPDGAVFGDVVGSGDDPTLLVFLRHYG